MTSFSRLHPSRSYSSRRLIEQINLHFMAVYTRWLIKEAKKCEQLSWVFSRSENRDVTWGQEGGVHGCTWSTPLPQCNCRGNEFQFTKIEYSFLLADFILDPWHHCSYLLVFYTNARCIGRVPHTNKTDSKLTVISAECCYWNLLMVISSTGCYSTSHQK